MPTPDRHPRPTRTRSQAKPPSSSMQIGRRPPNPMVPTLTGAMWVVVGVVILITFSATWRWFAGIFSIGVGLLFLRGGLAAVIRQDTRRRRQ